MKLWEGTATTVKTQRKTRLLVWAWTVEGAMNLVGDRLRLPPDERVQVQISEQPLVEVFGASEGVFAEELPTAPQPG